MTERKRGTKSRANGTGTAIKRGSTWTARVVIGWKAAPDGSHKIPDYRTKGGFARKSDALNYCAYLKNEKGTSPARKTLKDVYDAWEKFYEPRVDNSTMVCYRSAYRHFSAVHNVYMDLITAKDLQDCMDACHSGKRTHQNMKCVAGLLWAYALDANIVEKDVTNNLYIGKGKSVQRDPITDEEVQAIRGSIGKVRYAEYIYCLCYLGFRPGEMLELKKDMLNCSLLPDPDSGEQIPVWYFINGKKTDAGKDRVVIVPDQIIEYVLDRLYIPGTDLVFPMYKFKGRARQTLECFKPMSHEYFNKHVFKPLMEQLGFSGNKVPYCARHTYADMLKNAEGSDRAKASLIGHSQYLFTQTHYQSDNLLDLKSVVDSFQ